MISCPSYHVMHAIAQMVALGALAHLLMCAQTNRHTLQLALCGGGSYIYIYINTTLILILSYSLHAHITLAYGSHM